MEHYYSVLSRIEEIRDRFGIEAPDQPLRPSIRAGSGRGPLQPFFPDTLARALKSEMGQGMPGGPVAFEFLINSAAQKYDLPPALLKGLVKAESNFRPNAVSRVGAQGLTQLMPGTARALGVSDPFDPAQNIEGGAKYLRQQMDRFGDISLALAAYNAGPGAVAKYNGIPPYQETQNYVRKVLEYARGYGFQD